MPEDTSAPIPAHDATPAQDAGQAHPHAAEVFAGADFRVISGANLGDTLDLAVEAVAGDIYHLSPEAEPRRLLLDRTGGRDMTIAQGSAVGAPGDRVRLLERLILMTPEGDACDLVLLEHAPAGGKVAIWALPLSPVAARTPYTLVQIEQNPDPVRLSDLICISFGAGTRISLSDGRQVPIESLRPGDRVLTRDHGPQPLRWIGRATLRGTGSLAPVVITSGALGNEGDLVVGQHHRIFIYQHRRSALTEMPELLVQARYLVDGERVILRPGGFVDYYALAFDRHEIVYAQGIPCESLMVTELTVARLPEALATELQARFPRMAQAQHYGQDASRRLLDAMGRKALFQGRGGDDT